MFKSTQKIYTWATEKVSSPFAPLWLGIIFLLELILFIPLDAILIIFCLDQPKKRFFYAFIATLASTLSGIIGYFIGLLLWDTIGPFVIKHLISESFFMRLVNGYHLYENSAVFLGSFLPLPFKAVTLSAGFCQVALFSFISFVFIARTLRFLLITLIIQFYGLRIKKFIDRHYNHLFLAIAAKIILVFGFVWALSQ